MRKKRKRKGFHSRKNYKKESLSKKISMLCQNTMKTSLPIFDFIFADIGNIFILQSIIGLLCFPSFFLLSLLLPLVILVILALQVLWVILELFFLQVIELQFLPEHLRLSLFEVLELFLFSHLVFYHPSYPSFGLQWL